MSTVKEHPLNNKEILTLVDVETSPRIRQLDMGIHIEDRGEIYSLFKRFFKRLPDSETQIFLVAKLNGKVIGFLGIHRQDEHMRQVGEVGLTIHPEHWGRGYGTLLLQASVEHVRQEGFLRLDADTIAKKRLCYGSRKKLVSKSKAKEE